MANGGLFEQITTTVSTYANVYLIIILLGIGKMIKSAPFFKRIPNDSIPFFLYLLSIIISLCFIDTSLSGACIGVLSAAISVGFHQFGKNSVKMIKEGKILELVLAGFGIESKSDDKEEKDNATK